MLPKVKKANMAVMVEVMNKYMRSHCGVLKVPIEYIIKKTIVF